MLVVSGPFRLVGVLPISIIVTQKHGPVEAPCQYLLRDHQARAQRTWQITPWLTEVLCVCVCVCVCAMSLQLCLTLCDPMDCSLPGSSVHGIFLGKNTGVGCHALLQGILPTQGSNLSLLPPPSVAGFFTAQAVWEAPKEFQAMLNSITALSRSEVFANSSGLL